MDSAHNKLIYVPKICIPVGKGVIITRTTQYTDRKFGGIVLPDGKDQAAERKFDVGEVLAVGPEVEVVKVGDIAVWQQSTGFRMPNGVHDPVMWKVEEFPMSIIAILPNLDPEKRSENWKDAELDKALEPYIAKWHELEAELAKEGAGEGRLLPPEVDIPTVSLGETGL